MNILSYEYELKLFSNADAIDSAGVLAEELIKDMISKDSLYRPTAKAILTHPFFWNGDKILNFLQVIASMLFTFSENENNSMIIPYNCRM